MAKVMAGVGVVLLWHGRVGWGRVGYGRLDGRTG
jgi:hypothetical protein